MFELSSNGVLKPIIDIGNITCRQQLPPTYVLNGSLYLASRSLLERENSFINAQTLGYVMSPERSIDIDTLLDWKWAEFLLHHQH